MAKYVASQGDTLKSLAKKYGLTRKRIRALNPDLKFGKGKKFGGKGGPLLKLKGKIDYK